MASKILMSFFALLVFCYLAKADETNDLLEMILKRSSECTISMHCPTKYHICVQHVCRSRVPCNKDNDCFFYAAADVANAAPHPKCYRETDENRLPAGYGLCMAEERVGNDPTLTRVKGLDVDSLDKHPIDTSGMQ